MQEYSTRKANQAEIPQLLSFYVGYTASLVTANILPMLLGFSIMTARNDDIEKQRSNLNSVKEESSRRCDLEKTSLLDEDNF